MAYRIEYDSRIGKYEIRERRAARFPLLLMMALGLFLVITFGYWENGAEVLREILIPGDNTVTVRAFRMMTDDLRSGAGMGQALQAFCAEVIHGTPAD